VDTIDLQVRQPDEILVIDILVDPTGKFLGGEKKRI
jgi:hypothetical protein